ncbi:MAG TPA: EamA family transporter [Candidatus Paceibacterota bacterium]|nr:EamA family transporter [Candidatus Paceibacterota bacterium]
MDWRMLAVGAMFLYGFGTYFVARATPVHGPYNAAFLQVVVYTVVLLLLGFGRSEISRFTTQSLTDGLIAATMFVIGSLCIFAAIGNAPGHAAVVEGLVAAHFIVSGVLVHLLIKPMPPMQWVGIITILIGVIVTLRATPP